VKIARISTIGATAALGLGLVLAPTVAQAAPVAPEASQSIEASGNMLRTPVDQTTYEQQLDIDWEVGVLGQSHFTMKVAEAKPGATVRVTVNGKLSTGVANKKGVAKVQVTFLNQNNPVSVQQVKGAKSSPIDTYSYDFTQR
jgi:hypothetical protein